MEDVPDATIVEPTDALVRVTRACICGSDLWPYASMEPEKVSDLPRRLSTADAPEGVEPAAGDITYYAPWGNLAIFHRDFDYSTGLVKLGSIDSGIEALAHMDFNVNVTVRRADAPGA